MTRLPPLAFAAFALAFGAFASASAQDNDIQALEAAKAEAAQAGSRSSRLDQQARQATNEAERARAASAALAARIEVAEAELTAAERRIAIITQLQQVQRARLAERQAPVIRLTAALQTMTRRPGALALIQPGSVRDAVHVRSLLAATMPEIRRRTAALRFEVARSNLLRSQAEIARQVLIASRATLHQRRVDLAQFEIVQRARSQQLAGLALSQSDRALAFGEEARSLEGTIGRRGYQAQLAASLSRLPGPSPRPDNGAPPGPRQQLPYTIPVEGRLVTGVGEISDGGVHARGLTFETATGAQVIAPAGGRVVYAAPFRRYGNVVIIDHGRGWASVITDLAALDVALGQMVRRGAPLGRGGPQITVELRRNGRPVPFAQLVSG